MEESGPTKMRSYELLGAMATLAGGHRLEKGIRGQITKCLRDLSQHFGSYAAGSEKLLKEFRQRNNVS